MGAVILHRLPGSHYVARVEYLLALKGVPFTRNDLTYRNRARTLEPLSGQDEVPVLEHAGNVVTWRDIPEYLDAHYPDPPLLPRDDRLRRQALAIETWADLDLGHRIRRIAYHALARDSTLATAYFGGGIQGRILAATITRWVTREYGITAITHAHDLDFMDAAVAAADDILAQNGYLVGKERTRADVAVAALMEPVLRIPALTERWQGFRLLAWVEREVAALKEKRRALRP